MTNSSNPDHRDDGRAWGWIDSAGIWRVVPKQVLLMAALGPPPFSVTMAGGGEVRHIVHNPNGEDASVAPETPDEKGVGNADTLGSEPTADLFPEDALPPFHVMRHPGDTDEGWEITSTQVAAALGVPWPLM